MAQHPSSLPPAFAELERRLAYLAELQSTGRITPNEFQTEVQKLTVRDASGAMWWLGGAPGAWRCWDGRAWIPTQPPPAAPARPHRYAAQASGRRWGLPLGIGVVLIAC